MKLWLRYFREKKGTVFLYLLTVFLFLTVGSLYHIENLEKLSYAALLTLVFWVLAGLWNGWKYVRRSRRLEEVFRHFEQSGKLLWETDEEKWLQESEGNPESAQDMSMAYAALLVAVCEQHERQKRLWEAKSADQNDYSSIRLLEISPKACYTLARIGSRSRRTSKVHSA